MSGSKAISLQNLALRLCGEAPDSDITSDDCQTVRDCLIGYMRDGKLKPWLNNNPYPSVSIIDELFNHELYDGVPINTIDWQDHAEKNAHLIKIRREVFEKFLDDAIKRNIDEAESAATRREQGKGKFTLKGMKFDPANQDYINAIAEGEFLTHLKDLYEKNHPWSDDTAPTSEQGSVAAAAKKSEAKKQDAIPQKGFYVCDADYSTVFMDGKQCALSTENRRQIVAVLHKKGQPMKLADLNDAAKGYRGRNIVADSFKNAKKIKTTLLKNHPRGHWQLKGV